MAAQYLGSLTLYDLVPGLARPLEQLRLAAATLSATIAVQLPVLEGVGLALDVAVLGDVQAQLDATLAAGVSLTAVNPAVQLGLIVQGALAAIANLQVTPPSIQISAQIAANASVAAQLEARRAALALILEPLNLALAALAALVEPLTAALSVAVGAGISASVPGIRAYRVAANLGVALGQVDALVAAGETDGLGASTPVEGIVFVVDQGNLTARAAFNAAFVGG
jgi:hypothetical protein